MKSPSNDVLKDFSFLYPPDGRNSIRNKTKKELHFIATLLSGMDGI